MPVLPSEKRALIAVVCAFALIVLGVILIDAPLGHDESVYATWARSWHTSQSTDGVVALHRAPALPLLALPLNLVTGAEEALRLIGLVFGVAALISVWGIGRLLGGGTVGLLAASVYGSAWTIIDGAALFLTDLPAAAALFAGLLACLRGLIIGRGPRPVLLWSAPFWALAIYLRFGSALPVLITIVGVTLVWRREVVASPYVPLLAITLFALLMSPLAIAGLITMGTPWGYLTTTTEAAGRAYLGEGVVYYLKAFPFRLVGPLAACVAVLGLGSPWIVPRSMGGVRGILRLLVGVAVSDMLLLGLVAHGEARFVFFPMGLLIAAGSTGLVIVTRRLVGSRSSQRHLRSLAVGVMVVAFLLGDGFAAAVRRNQEDRLDGLRTAAGELAAAHDGACDVATSYTPQIAWYSRCAVTSLQGGAPGVRRRLSGPADYVFLLEGGKRQPQGADLDAFLVELDAGQPEIFGDGRERLYPVPASP